MSYNKLIKEFNVLKSLIKAFLAQLKEFFDL